MERYLTKSRFKLALECPTKLFYIGKKKYVNKKGEDNFLMELARGGFQVGLLAQQYFTGGILIDTLDVDEAIKKTNKLLKDKKAVIYEAAFRYKNLLIRADI
jgi:hypothetical protein